MKLKRWLPVLSGTVLLTLLLGVLLGTAGAQGVAGPPYPYYIPAIFNPPPPTPTRTPTRTPTATVTRTPTNTPTLPPISNTPPRWTTSYYFAVADPANLNAEARQIGCELGTRDLGLPGKQDNLVILDFGTTKYVNGQYGASLMYRNGFGTIAQIGEAVKQFGYGYWDCVESDFDSHLRIGIGTNNYTGSTYPSVTYGHGQAWAAMVNQVNDWFVNNCPRSCDGQVDAAGANDIELGWGSPEATIDWLNGYDSVNRYPMYNYGALPGCPYFAAPGSQCGGNSTVWTKERVWLVTDAGPVQSLPEIYRNDGVNAQQWYLMSVWAYQNKGKPMDFIGVMTQYQACLQRASSDPTCATLDNTANQGWTQLHNLINGDVRTRWPLQFSTDIKWLGE
ncbi:MAG TPA: hypothetical protein VFF68_05295 [Anaerolineaceae bacterium]|nr:hypothetical protein [Anaerolineaceae bacterium]